MCAFCALEMTNVLITSLIAPWARQSSMLSCLEICWVPHNDVLHTLLSSSWRAALDVVICANNWPLWNERNIRFFENKQVHVDRLILLLEDELFSLALASHHFQGVHGYCRQEMD